MYLSGLLFYIVSIFFFFFLFFMFYMLHTEHKKLHSTSQVRTFLRCEGILADIDKRKGLFEGYDVVLRIGFKLGSRG